jgi:hypothetical protein
MWNKIAIAQLNKYSNPCGKCMFCGHKDKRHRLWDSWLSLSKGGETVEFIASLYDVNTEYVKLILKLKPYHKN